jgi:multidrug efflux pump subunit AcrA (membrane-fusion protein)
MTDTRSLRALPPGRQDDQRAEGLPARRRRHFLRWLLPALLLAAAAATVWQLTAQDPPTYLTEEARSVDLQDRVEAAAVVAFPQAATAELRSPVGGTLTHLAVKEGDRPVSLTIPVRVSDAPLVVLESPLPLFRDLTEDVQGADVAALESALRAAGYAPGPDDSTFDAETAAALEAWEAANGLEATGELPLSRMLWLPPGGQVTSVSVRPGDPVGAGSALASVAVPTALVVHAPVAQADVAKIAAGDPVEVELDALDDPLSGIVEAVALTSDEDGMYRATVRLDALPETVRAGMEGTARVLVDLREDAVVVPSGAVATSDGQPTVRVLVDGEPEVREVELGLVTTDGAEILTGVAPGDAIVVGEQD